MNRVRSTGLHSDNGGNTITAGAARALPLKKSSWAGSLTFYRLCIYAGLLIGLCTGVYRSL